MVYNIGYVLICSTDILYGNKNPYLIIGHKYIILDVIKMFNDERVILDVKHLSSSKRIGFVDGRHFITIDDYRDFQLGKILN